MCRPPPIAEDFHTSIVLHQQGWHTHYVDETVLLGLAPHDLDSFLLQRSRWARGNLRVFLTRRTRSGREGCDRCQRLSYLGSLFHYFGGPQRLALLVVLCATLLSGILPLHGEPILFAVLWAPWVALSLLSTKVLGRGVVGSPRRHPVRLDDDGHLHRRHALLIVPGVGKFKVTPKMGIDEGGPSTLHRLRLLTACAAALLIAVLLRAGAALGWVALPSMPLFAQIGTFTIGVIELIVIGAVLRALIARRQRRHVYRFAVDVRASVGDELVQVVDLNHHGAGLLAAHPPSIGDPIDMTLRLPALDGRDRAGGACTASSARSCRPGTLRGTPPVSATWAWSSPSCPARPRTGSWSTATSCALRRSRRTGPTAADADETTQGPVPRAS